MPRKNACLTVFLIVFAITRAMAQFAVTATGGDRQVTLSWAPVPEATAYRVGHAEVLGGPYDEIVTGLSSNLYVHSGLANGTTNYYVVTASTPGGDVGSAETNARAWVYVRVRAINCGGAAVPPFQADASYTGGGVYLTNSAINRSAVTDPAPEPVYQAARTGASDYVFAPFHPSRRYRIRAHYAEIVYTNSGNRSFHVFHYNGGTETYWSTWVDIIGTAGWAGAPNKAVIRQIDGIAPNAAGQIRLRWAQTRPLVSGIEILAADGPLPSVRAAPRDGAVLLDFSASIDVQEFDVAASVVSGGPYQMVSTGVTDSTWIHAGLTNGLAVYYKITARSNWGEAETEELAAIPGVACYAINVNGVQSGRFIPENASYTRIGGTAGSTTTVPTIPLGTPDPAESAAVYQTFRTGAQTNVFGGLQPGEAYRVRFHFNEPTKNAASARVFHVDVQSDRVLTNLDVFAQAGGMHRALVREAVCTADGEGKLTVTLTPVTDQPILCGIEIRQQSGTMTPPPPSGVAAANQLFLASLIWNNTARDLGYTIWRAESSGGPYAVVASNIVGSSYLDRSITYGQPYYYRVAGEVGGTAVDGSLSGEVTATVQPGTNTAGLFVQYFGGYSETGAVETLAGTDGVSVLDTNWGSGPIGAPSVGDRNAKVVWNGRLALNRNAAYTFHARANGQFRLWVTNQCVINRWTTPQTGEVATGTFTAGALTGLYPVRAEFANDSGNASATLEWEASDVGLGRETVPEAYWRPVALGDPSPWVFRDIAMGSLPGYGETPVAYPDRIGLYAAGAEGIASHQFACRPVTGPFELTARLAYYNPEGRYGGTWNERMGLVIRSRLSATNGFAYGIVHDNNNGTHNTRVMYKDNLAVAGAFTETAIVNNRRIPMYLRMRREKVDGLYVISAAYSADGLAWDTNFVSVGGSAEPTVYAGLSLGVGDSALLYGYFDSIDLRDLRVSPGGAILMVR